MTKLDETGLAAARLAFLRSTGSDPLLDALAAYLAATRTSNVLRDLQRLGQECETPDRLALVVNAEGEGMGCTITATTVVDWQVVEEEARGYSSGPWRRQIVRCNLLRPEPVGEIFGTTEPA